MSKGSNRRPEREPGLFRRHWDRTFRHELAWRSWELYDDLDLDLVPNDPSHRERKGLNGKEAAT